MEVLLSKGISGHKKSLRWTFVDWCERNPDASVCSFQTGSGDGEVDGFDGAFLLVSEWQLGREARPGGAPGVGGGRRRHHPAAENCPQRYIALLSKQWSLFLVGVSILSLLVWAHSQWNQMFLSTCELLREQNKCQDDQFHTMNVPPITPAAQCWKNWNKTFGVSSRNSLSMAGHGTGTWDKARQGKLAKLVMLADVALSYVSQVPFPFFRLWHLLHEADSSKQHQESLVSRVLGKTLPM